MVDSRALARLIDHASASEAKLVLIGDPAQLGEIEAGGLFAALASRTEPVVLDEVIRHRHELDRQAAKKIREGEGAEAISVYQGAERVTVSEDPLARRQAMVADWWERYREGEDALMLAKRNAEVRELNALAREQMAAEGRLGGEEIRVGEAAFAVGDQVITRINDQKLQVFNRERWRIAEVDVESRRVVLDGIDTARRVGVDSVFLERVNPRDGAAALEHGYAATIYQAQGSTLDSAFVMADPSMTREEFYVATSRTREETYLYATPEVQAAREEVAPRSPYLRGGLEHISEAAERVGAQSAAMDEVLRSRFAELPTEELIAQVRELRSEVGAELHNASAHRQVEEGLQREEDALDRIGRATPEGDHQDRFLQLSREATEQRVEQLQAERARLAEVSHEARAKAAVAEHVLSERARLAATAARISPPDYITHELGERPSNPKKAAAWDRGVSEIESYRTRNGVMDRDNALGPKPQERSAQQQQRRAREAVERTQLQRQRQRAVERSVGLGIGR